MNRPVERCGDGPPIAPRKGIGSTTGVSVSSTAGPGATVKLDARFCWMGNGSGGSGIEGLAFGQNLIRNFTQFADYVEPGEHLKAVV